MHLEYRQKGIDVHLTGAFRCSREAARPMLERKNPGVIESISSINRSGRAGQTNYTASKAAVAARTVTWVKELSRYWIRVVALAPVDIGTEMTGSISEDVRMRIESVIPASQFGTLRRSVPRAPLRSRERLRDGQGD